MKLICPAGKIVTGGGFDSGSTYLRSDDGATEPNGGEDNLNSPIRRSYPSALDSWTVEFDPDRMGLQAVTAYAVCIAAAAPTS
jgi:hypothetical protein